MARIRILSIRNYRSIKSLTWYPLPGFNCLIGPGDSGKSTLLDAIELVLGGRRPQSFTDADFYNLNVAEPIVIDAVIGDLPDELRNVEVYGDYFCGFNLDDGTYHDEPVEGCELALILRLEVDSTLSPSWRLVSNRTEGRGQERYLNSKHRNLVVATRLGASTSRHFAWGNGSVLNKLSDQQLEVGPLLNQLSRNMRESFAESQPTEVGGLLTQVANIAVDLGVEVGPLNAQLDVKASSIAFGAISLHNGDGTPLRQLGTGSTRLLLSGLHKAASSACTLLIDEAEHGLEPYRISRLLAELGAKRDGDTPQIFITTHSPYVIRELQSNQLWVVRKNYPVQGEHSSSVPSHTILSPGLGSVSQATVRACAEAFLSKTVVVCEGKTEVGLVKGIDLYLQESTGQSLASVGAYCTDGGGGGNFYSRAHVFRGLGYNTVIFKDSDTAAEHANRTELAQRSGIAVIEWGENHALESALFSHCPPVAIPQLMKIATEWKGESRINSAIEGYTGGEYNLAKVTGEFVDTMRPTLAHLSQGPQKIPGTDKKWPSWYKDIAPGERVGREVVGPYLNVFLPPFQNVIRSLFACCGVNLT